MLKSTLTRRALVASTAAVPAAVALSLPAVADASGEDVEILKLGARLERVGQEWLAQRAIDAKERAEWEAACEAAGLPRLEHGSVPDHVYKARQDQRSRIPCKEEDKVNEHGEAIVWNDVHDRIDALIDEIFEYEPQTLAGLAVQAHALVFDNSPWWDACFEPDDFMVSFFEAFCAFVGTSPAPIALARQS